MIAEWSGPAWAAPESAERLRTGTEVSPPDLDRRYFGALCDALAEGRIDALRFRVALAIFREWPPSFEAAWGAWKAVSDDPR